MQNEPIEIENIIIGAGLAGLYLGYELSERNQNFIIFDKNDFVGGRMLVAEFHKSKVALGSGIIEKDNIHLLKLLEKLNIKTNKFRNKYHYPHMEKYTKSIPNEPELFERHKNMLTLIQSTFEEHKEEIKKCNLTFKQFLKIYFDKKFVTIFLSNTYYTDFLDADVETTMNEYPLTSLLAESFEDYLYIEGGNKVLVDVLYEKIKDKVKLSSCVTKIIKKENYYIVIVNNKDYYKTNKLLFCGDLAIKYIETENFSLGSVLDHIGSVEFARCYTYHDTINFNYNLKTTSLLDKMIYYGKHVIMSCYNDSAKAKVTKKLIIDDPNGLENFNKILHCVLLPELISPAKDIISKYWEHGVHYYKPGGKPDHSELNKQNIFILGEITSDHQGFMEGAIKTVDAYFDLTEQTILST